MNSRHLVGADLNLLLMFDALWRERSVTQAAAWLRVSQSATSHSLGRLRALVGDPLFVRGGDGMVPTPRAEAMAPKVAATLASALQALQSPPTFEPASASGSVRLGLTDYASAVILPALLRRLSRFAPGVRLEARAVDARDLGADLERDVVDLAFGPAPEADRRLRHERLYAEPLVCAVDASLWRGRALTIDAYLAAPHLVVSYDGEAASWADKLLAERGLSRKVGLVLPHGLALRDVLVGTDMVCTIAEGVVLRGAPEIEARPHPLEQRSIEVHAIWPNRLDADPLHRWVREQAKVALEARDVPHTTALKS